MARKTTTQAQLDHEAYTTWCYAGNNYTAAARKLGISPMTARARVLRHKKTQAAAETNATAKHTTHTTHAHTTRRSVDLTVPRCGTCYAPCDLQDSDEGYSHCCNDRIEYPDEYCQSWTFRTEVLGEDCPHNRTWKEEDREVPGRFFTTCEDCGQDLGFTEG